jgi:MFS transporter, MHS family, proline/betaine transporter
MTMPDSQPIHVTEHSSEKQNARHRHAVAAAGAGNALEWYDFAVYVFLTPVLAKLFFPTFDQVAGIIASFGVFAVGFGMRPVGAIVFGHIADRFGRKRSLVTLVSMMGIATIIVGVIPTYSSVGIAAPVMLLLARLLQGLAVGGEFGTSASFLVEYANPGRRGLIGSLAYVTVYCGNIAGGLMVLVMTTTLTKASLFGWGWRVPFLAGFPLLLLGLYMRLRIDDTPQFQMVRRATQTVRSPLLIAMRQHWRAMLIVLGLNICFGISAYTVLSFMQSYLTSLLHYPPTTALVSVLIGIAVGAILTPVAGLASDIFGVKPVLLCSCIGIVVLAYPSYLLLGVGNFAAAVSGQLLLWLPVAGLSGAFPAASTQMFPANVRVSGFGVAYSLSTAVFSGTTPFVATLLVRTTASLLSPAWYLAAAGALSIGFVVAMREAAVPERRAGSSQPRGAATRR